MQFDALYLSLYGLIMNKFLLFKRKNKYTNAQAKPLSNIRVNNYTLFTFYLFHYYISSAFAYVRKL
ncbi:hypothetical protein CWC11_03490 [Pseudoalteromonas sp. S3178]|nr:hypothetical protein CWC11_03490 [Pseudoalteromonas sp. S3178]